jgi:predicted porin
MAQVNASAFHIDWQDIQFNLPLRGCAFAFLANAAQGKSDGFDVQATTRVGPFTVNANVSYTDARFAETLYTNSTKTTVIANKGDNLGIPDWNIALGAQYDFTLGAHAAYVRADFQHTGKYMRTTGVGTTSYDALFVDGETTDTANARAGVTLGDIDLALFAQNLTNSDEFVNKGHPTRTSVITGTSFRPRTIGIQARYKF